MNQQESQQISQGWSDVEPRPLSDTFFDSVAPVTRPLNTDPREQPQPMPPLYQPQPFIPRPRKRRPWLWGLAAVLLVGLLFGLAAVVLSALYRSVSEHKAFTVSGIPTLVMQVNSGSVHIESGPAGQVSVEAKRHVFLGNSDLIQVHYSQSGSTITITSDEQNGFSLFGDNSVEFEVFVPSQSNLSITTDSGEIQANGIIGTIQLHASSGEIQADNLAGALTLITESGTITGSNLKGQMTLRASSGEIDVKAVSATDNSSFQTDSGSIDFQGTLDPNGTYLFRVESGSVDLTLAQNASFHVDATTQSGSIDSDFPSISVQRHDSGAEAHGDVGAPPLATIVIQAESGSITLHQD